MKTFRLISLFAVALLLIVFVMPANASSDHDRCDDHRYSESHRDECKPPKPPTPTPKPIVKVVPPVNPYSPPLTVCEFVAKVGTVPYSAGDSVKFTNDKGAGLGIQFAYKVRADGDKLVVTYVKGDALPAGVINVFIHGTYMWTWNNCVYVPR